MLNGRAVAVIAIILSPIGSDWIGVEESHQFKKIWGRVTLSKFLHTFVKFADVFVARVTLPTGYVSLQCIVLRRVNVELKLHEGTLALVAKYQINSLALENLLYILLKLCDSSGIHESEHRLVPAGDRHPHHIGSDLVNRIFEGLD